MTDVDAKGRGKYLCNDRIGPLADIHRPLVQNNRTIFSNARFDGRGIGQRRVPAAVPATRNTHTALSGGVMCIKCLCRSTFFGPGRTQRLETGLNSNTLTEDLATNGGRSILQHIGDAKLERVLPKLICQFIKQAFLRDG